MDLGKIKTGRSYRKVIIAFAIISVVLILGVAYLSFASASIKITPKVDRGETTFSAHVEPKPNLDPRKPETIPGRVIEASEDGNLDINQVSIKQVPEKAHGTVVFKNERGQAQPLLATTQLLASNGVLFRTVDRVVIPAGGSVSAQVVADQAGASGNVGPTHFTIVKLFKGWQNQIYADSSGAMTGGVREVREVSEADLNAARDQLAEQLYPKAIEKLRGQLASGETLVDQAIRKEILNFTTTASAGTDIDHFSITMTGRATAVVFDQNTLLELATTKLQAELPNDREIANASLDNLTYAVKNYDLNAGTAELEVHFTAQTVLKLGKDVFDRTKLFGLKKSEVENYFKNFADVEKVDVHFSPFWITTVPAIESKVNIEIIPPAPAKLDTNEQK